LLGTIFVNLIRITNQIIVSAMIERRSYPTDVSDEEWNFVAPYLPLMDGKAPQLRYELRETFNALRWIVRAGAA
jgi:hypothetical protein